MQAAKAEVGSFFTNLCVWGGGQKQTCSRSSNMTHARASRDRTNVASLIDNIYTNPGTNYIIHSKKKRTVLVSTNYAVCHLIRSGK